MKRTLATLPLLFAAAGLFALSAKVTYTEGTAAARLKSGKAEDVRIGRMYDTGDSIRTGKDGEVELDQAGLVIRIQPSTVFTLLEKQVGRTARSVLAVTLGSVRMKYAMLTGSEPLIQSVGCIAGVRGTELAVVAGADGSSLIAVTSGLVSVEAFGKTVELGPDEAVEVINGQPPGEKFAVRRDQVDYLAWGEERLESLRTDPLAALAGMRERLRFYAETFRSSRGSYEALKARLDGERQEVKRINGEKGTAEALAYEREHVAPLIEPTQNYFLDARYHLLAAYGMRRFVGGRMYLLLKIAYLNEPQHPVWVEFLARYREFLEVYETEIARFLVEADY